jgi:integrase
VTLARATKQRRSTADDPVRAEHALGQVGDVHRAGPCRDIPIRAAAGLSRITFHDLRHSYATGALKAGVSPKILSERIGHADVGFFLQTYAHVITNDDREAAEQAASFLIGDGWDPEPDDKQA